jgi:hypothetical protein
MAAWSVVCKTPSDDWRTWGCGNPREPWPLRLFPPLIWMKATAMNTNVDTMTALSTCLCNMLHLLAIFGWCLRRFDLTAPHCRSAG